MPPFGVYKLYKIMNKLLYSRYIVSLALFVLSASFLSAQDFLELRGRLLMDMQIINGAKVTVFDGKQIIKQTTTNGAGNFFIKVPFGKMYVLQFQKSGLPTQKIVLNAKKNRDNRKDNKQRVILTLSSKNSSKEGYSMEDAVATFEIKETGEIAKNNKPIDKSEFAKQNPEIEKIEEKIEDLETDIKKGVEKLTEEQKKQYLEEYRILQQKKDSILALVNSKADLIIKDAENEAKLIKASNSNLNKQGEQKIIYIEKNANINNDLQNFAIPKQKFLAKKEVKNYQEIIDKYNKKQHLTHEDSLEYFKTITLIKEEVIKSAWLQLKIDKLNAKTHEDSIILQKREMEIKIAERKIEQAKVKIKLQNAEITYKNYILIFVFMALTILIIFFFLLYINLRNKKKTNKILERKNSEIASQNRKILDSIQYAKTIQQAVLPLDEKIRKHFDWFIVYFPKDIVSGDFYWFHHFDDLDLSVIAVVDCTGHGVPGAFMSLIGNRLLVEAVKEKRIINPIEILETIDEGIKLALMQDQTSNNDGMDVCLCTIQKINETERKVLFCGAKRPIFYTDKEGNKINYIKGTIRGIGGRQRLRRKSKKEFVEHELLLKKGDRLYLTTDGLFDLQSPDNIRYGRTNFVRLLEKINEKELKEQELAIKKTIEQHQDNTSQEDDITILGLKL